MRFNWKVIINILSILVLVDGLFMLSCLPFALFYNDSNALSPSGGVNELLIPGLSSAVLGTMSWWATRKNSRKLNKRDGYLIVTFGWLIMSITGAIPYYMVGGPFVDFASALFESISGFTTTGATVFTEEHFLDYTKDRSQIMPHALFVWRSMTHWIGGMGIIVLTIAILPLLGIGGMQLFVAEAPGPTADKLHPRITETAKRLWIIYIGLTGIEIVLLMLAGMNFFDALNHSFATVSTGGFSTQGASVGAYNAGIHYIIIIVMFLSGMNFSLTYFGLKGKLDRIYNNEEFRVYLGIVLLATLVSTVVLMCTNQDYSSVEKAFRDSLFQVVAFITTTGFGTAAPTTDWGPFLKVLFFLLMFMGASAGSTAGGVKIVRHIVILKNGIMEFKRQLHPNAIIPVRLDNKMVPRNITLNILAFFLIYMTIYAVSILVMASMGYEYELTMGAIATSLGNVGPGLGAAAGTFGFFSAPLKYFLSFLMLLGRLELFTVLILFTPFFWKKY